MGKGYAEGPALEERLAAAESGPATVIRRRPRKAVFGSTQRKHDRHFLGWLGEVDPDELFSSGQAWGLSVAEIADESVRKAAPAVRKAAPAAKKPAAAPKKPVARPRKLAKAS
jgi:hypothetical protein